jgi:hypothetical protein
VHRINIILPVGVLASTGNPDGAGPIAEDKGATGFSYQDATRSLIFGTEQVQVEDSALGKIVTVVIVPTVDIGNATFSLVAPLVALPSDAGASKSSLSRQLVSPPLTACSCAQSAILNAQPTPSHTFAAPPVSAFSLNCRSLDRRGADSRAQHS